MQTIRWAVVGPGRAASRFAEGLKGVPGAELVAVWGRTQARAQAFAQRYGVGRVAASLEALFADDVDAVYIGTYPDSHAELSLRAIVAGKAVFCEKPSALNRAQLEQVLAAAAEHGVLYMEAMKSPFFPLYRKLRAVLAVDPIGQVGYVRAGHALSTLAPDYPLHFLEIGGGGVLGIGPYEAFLALDWLGELDEVQTMGRLATSGVDSFAVFQTRHQHGYAQLHTGIDLNSIGDALLAAPGGSVVIHANWWNPQRATIRYTDGRVVELDEPFSNGGFNYETEHFCELLRAGMRESPQITHALSRQMAELLERARRAVGVRFPGEQ